MNVFVIGCGSAGSRWARLAKGAGHHVTAYDPRPDTLTVLQPLGVVPVVDVAAGIRQKPDGAILATWPSAHIGLALRMVQHGIPVLIEKPLGHSLDGLDALVAEVERRKLVASVVCNLRYHPNVAVLREMLASDRLGRVLSLRLECGSDVRQWRAPPAATSYGLWKVRGGGVMLDAIHELDLACHLVGTPDRHAGFAVRTGTLDGDAEDVAVFLLKHPAGIVSSVHLDYLQRTNTRRATVVGTEGRTEVDFVADAAVWETTYVETLHAWLRALNGGPVVNGIQEAARTLRVALSARSA